MRNVFIVRAERQGEAEARNLREGVCSIGWHEVPNPLTYSDEVVEAFCATHFFREGTNIPARDAALMILTFAHDEELDDAVIVLPRLAPEALGCVALGLCMGKAFYDEQATGTDADPRLKRPVTWIHKALPRAIFGEAAERVFAKVRHTVRRVREEEAVREILIIFNRLHK